MGRQSKDKIRFMQRNTPVIAALLLFSCFASAAPNDLVFNASNSGVIDFNTGTGLEVVC